MYGHFYAYLIRWRRQKLIFSPKFVQYEKEVLSTCRYHKRKSKSCAHWHSNIWSMRLYRFKSKKESSGLRSTTDIWNVPCSRLTRFPGTRWMWTAVSLDIIQKSPDGIRTHCTDSVRTYCFLEKSISSRKHIAHETYGFQYRSTHSFAS